MTEGSLFLGSILFMMRICRRLPGVLVQIHLRLLAVAGMQMRRLLSAPRRIRSLEGWTRQFPLSMSPRLPCACAPIRGGMLVLVFMEHLMQMPCGTTPRLQAVMLSPYCSSTSVPPAAGVVSISLQMGLEAQRLHSF